MTQWYYSDYDRNRHGPVSDRDLAELHANGQLAPDTLVWRPGLAQWQPWHSVMGEVISGAGRPAEAAASFATTAADAPASTAANPYAVAEPASPYAPPRAALADGHDYVDAGEVVYAGFWKRMAAYTIDSFLLTIVFGIVGAVLGFAGMANFGDPQSMASNMSFFAVFYLVELVVMVAYFAGMQASSQQATLGKLAVGIKVTDDDGHRIGLGRSIGRFFATIISSLTLCIGYLMAAFTERKRALHDMIAGTLVVDRWAFTAHPERQRHELGTVTTVVLVLAALLVVGYIALIVLMVGAMAVGAGSH